jgi:hypothetical protein
MAGQLDGSERGYLLAAIQQLAELEDAAPELKAHVHSAFKSCRSLCELVAEVSAPEKPTEDYLARQEGGSGTLVAASEVEALQAVAVSLRRVVNGCEAARPSFRRSVAASVHLTETLCDGAARGHLRVVVTV